MKCPEWESVGLALLFQRVSVYYYLIMLDGVRKHSTQAAYHNTKSLLWNRNVVIIFETSKSLWVHEILKTLRTQSFAPLLLYFMLISYSQILTTQSRSLHHHYWSISSKKLIQEHQTLKDSTGLISTWNNRKSTRSSKCTIAVNLRWNNRGKTITTFKDHHLLLLKPAVYS